MELRRAHREKVARNEVRVSTLWARPCRAYNVQIELDPRTRSSLEKIQLTLRQAEPNLLVCPEKTLHVSVAWLLGVHASYPLSKDSLWERDGEEWMTELRRIAAESTLVGTRLRRRRGERTDPGLPDVHLQTRTKGHGRAWAHRRSPDHRFGDRRAARAHRG